MEDEMREFYGPDQSKSTLSSPSAGQLVAVRAEEEEEILRAQVCEVMAEKVKVRRRWKHNRNNQREALHTEHHHPPLCICRCTLWITGSLK